MKRCAPGLVLMAAVVTLLVAVTPAQGQFVPVFVSETLVNNNGSLSGGNTSPSITPLSEGRFIVAWHDGGPTTGWGRVYSSSGTPEGAQFSLNPNGPGGWQYGHVVAARPGGGIVSFWGYDSGSVLGQQFNSQFTPVGDDFFNYGYNAWPAVASSKGNPVLNINYPSSPGGPVLIILFDSSLKSYSTITANLNPPGIGLSPAIAAAPNGNFTPAWANAAGNIIVRTFKSNGTALTGEVTVNSSTGGSRGSMCVAYNSQNELWVAWDGNQSGNYDIYLRQFAADGTPTGPEFVVNQNTSGDQTVPQVAVGPNDEVAVSWTGSDASGDGVFARIFNPDGTPATDQFQVNQYTSGNQYTGWAGGERGTFITEGEEYIFTWVGTGAQGAGVYMTEFNPPATLTPASDTYAKQEVTTASAAKKFTLTNDLAVTLTDIVISTTGDFEVSATTCTTSLEAKKKCTISVTFTPTATGTRTGQLSVSDSANNSPQTASLTGTGVVPAALTPASETYAKQAVGTTSAAKTFTLTNDQDVALTDIVISTTGDFAAAATTCATSLAAGKKCTISVTFTPTATGTRTGQLSVSDSANNSPQTASLTGTGVVPAVLTPASATYAKQAVGTTSAAKTFILTNDQPVTLTSIAISTTGDFAASATTCTTSLVPNGKCSISVTFTPTATGTRPGQLSVSDSASNSPQTANLTGTGE
jgi:hypothetical protein